MDHANDVSKLREFAGFVIILFFILVREAHYRSYSHFQLGFKKHVPLSIESSFHMKINSLVGDSVCGEATL